MPEETTETTTVETTETAAQPAEVDFKAESRKWEARAKENAAKLKDVGPQLAELEQLRAANKTEAERQAEELSRWQAEAGKWRTDAIGNRIQALATDFADPSDAASALDPAQYLDAGGQINEDAIKADLADLLTRKPHWRRGDGTAPAPRPPAPNYAQGSGGGRAAADPAAEFAAVIQSQLNGQR